MWEKHRLELGPGIAGYLMVCFSYIASCGYFYCWNQTVWSVVEKKKIVNLCLKVEKVFLLESGEGCREENTINIIREIHVMCSKSTEEKNSEWSCSK